MRAPATGTIVCALLLGRLAHAQPAEPPPPPPPSPPAAPDEGPSLASAVRNLEIHGFVSQGALISTANDYLGHSSRGSVEFLEAAINVSTEVSERLRVGLQLFTRDLGPIGDYAMRLDWALIDYEWRPWLGMRAGRVKIPFGLYNEYSDIDAARTSILLPQGVYNTVNRDFLLAQTGFEVYGSPDLGSGGALDYRLYLGTIFIDPGRDPQVTSVDTEYVTGGQIFWRTPIAGLRIGGSLLLATINFDLKLDAATVASLIMAGVVPADFDGTARLSLHNANLWVGSIEYSAGKLLLAAEYSRWRFHTQSSVQALAPDGDTDSERFYALASYRVAERFEVGAYASFHFVDVGNRGGDAPEFARSSLAYQDDFALSLRYDITDHWLVKLEGHFIHGLADVSLTDNPDASKLHDDWGLFLAKTTVSF